MEILKNFGFDPVMLVAQIVNFLIVFYLLKRFLYKPVLDMLKKRKDAIEEGVKQAEEARQTLEKTLEEERKILLKAREEAKKIVEDARLQAKESALEIEEASKKQAEKIMLEAMQRIEQESVETERKLSEKISVLAADMLAKSLQGVFGTRDQKVFVDKAIKELKKSN